MSTEKQFITALGPNDQDDGDEGRQRRGLAISALTKIGQNQLGYMVPSQSGKGDYVVALGDTPFCTCPDFESRQMKCNYVIMLVCLGIAQSTLIGMEDDSSWKFFRGERA